MERTRAHAVRHQRQSGFRPVIRRRQIGVGCAHRHQQTLPGDPSHHCQDELRVPLPHRQVGLSVSLPHRQEGLRVSLPHRQDGLRLSLPHRQVLACQASCPTPGPVWQPKSERAEDGAALSPWQTATRNSLPHGWGPPWRPMGQRAVQCAALPHRQISAGGSVPHRQTALRTSSPHGHMGVGSSLPNSVFSTREPTGPVAALPHAALPHGALPHGALPNAALPYAGRRACGGYKGVRRGVRSQRATEGSVVGAASATKPTISVRDLYVSFGDKQVLAGADLVVERGTFHILLGPNGCGKSTLLKVLGGLQTADRGTVDVEGPVGFVFQNPDHQIVMPTVGADACFGLGRYELPTEAVSAQVAEALGLVGMADYSETPTHTLSGGQRQRIAIAGALAEDPQVLLLDELTTFLDVGDQRGVLDAVRAAVGGPRQVAALWVTHRTEELRFADAASFMDDGRILQSGSPKKVAEYMRSLGARVEPW